MADKYIPSFFRLLHTAGLVHSSANIITRFIPRDEPIDLLNVAFENPRSLKASASNQGKGEGMPQAKQRETYAVPDRLTGLEELEELKRLCPWRQWNFVEVDVTYQVSSSLIRPPSSV